MTVSTPFFLQYRKVNLDNRVNNFENLYKSQIFNEFP